MEKCNAAISGATYAPYAPGGATGTGTAANVTDSGVFWNTGDPAPTHTPVTYYVRADGTAANRALATGPATDPSQAMSLAVYNSSIFSPGDTIYFSAQGGTYTSTTTLSSEIAALHIVSSGDASSDINYVGLSDGDGGAKPLIDVSADASSPGGILIVGKNYVTVRNFRIKGSGGKKAFYFKSNSGIAGSGYTIKARDIDVLSNYGSSTGDSDCFASGNSTNDGSQAEFWDITATGCHESGAPASSYQALTLHEYGKAKIHTANFSDSNYWILNTVSTELEIDNLTATTPRIAGIMLANNASASNSIIVTDSNLSLGGTGGFITAQADADPGALLSISNSIIDISGTNAGIDTIRGTVKLFNNWITATSATWGQSLPDGHTLWLYNNVLNGLPTTFLASAGTANIYNNTVYNSSASGTFVNQTAGTLNLKNNIFENITDVLNSSGGTSNISNNIYYNSSNEGGDGSLTSDPLFTTVGTDFSLQSISPAINTGTSLGSDYDDAIYPGSTWPSSVTTADQDLRGAGWEIGVYIYSVPQTPTVQTPTVLNSSSIRWNFTDNSNDETGFRIYDSTDTLVASPATTNLSHIDETSLTENTSYSGRYVKAYNTYGESVASGTAASKYTLANTPTNLSGSSNKESITLIVDSFPNATSGSSGYYFSRSATNSGWIQANTWQDTGLNCGNSYDYSVKYRNGDGIETSSISLTKSTDGCGGGGLPSGAYTPPTVPTGGFNMLINNNAVTTISPNVSLSLTAGTDIKNMAISNFPDFKDSTQEPFQPTKQWDLCQQRTICPAGQYTVYVKFYTQYGQTSETIQDTISYTGTNQPTKTTTQTPQTQTQTQIEIQAQIAQIRQQLISPITQLIQMLYLQVEQMRR
ncbi:MAG: hypothetical protein Q8O66_03590 [bacterium]|nr:hypothetical protein [bacterium]